MSGARKPPQDESSSGLIFALQALLSRHESFVSDSQQQQSRLDSKIDQLESERQALQSANERIVAENKSLLSKLETLNDSYKASDNTVRTLEALLRDTEIEVRRLNGLARRAEELDARVQEMDKQRVELMRKITDGETESRSTLARWRESERKVRQLELEVERIEWEAKAERDKHEEVAARLERERLLERELGGTEGRLKGAAALQGIASGNSNGNAVVSHFVRDILQDNANLQAGIVELRELLQSSNDEVQNLRQQIMHHQPIDEDEPEDQLAKSVSLDRELDWDQSSPQPPQRAVHVHHHYHAKLASKPSKTPTIRRTSRRRTVMGVGTFSSPGSSGPPTPTARPHRYSSSPIVPFQLYQPQPRNRWSVQSSATMASTISSFPSSPRSNIFDRNNSIFDRLDPHEDSSRPTSPESASGFTSPSTFEKRPDGFEAVLEADDENLDFPEKENIPTLQDSPESQNTVVLPVEDLPKQTIFPNNPIGNAPLQPRPPDPVTTCLESEMEVNTPTTITHFRDVIRNTIDPENSSTTLDPSPAMLGPSQPEMLSISEIEIRPSLHRSSSHDSLVSISGMDIHLAKHPINFPPSRMRGNSAYFPLTPSSTRNITSSRPVATITGISAVSSKRSFSSDSQGPAGRSLQHLAGVPANPQTSPGGAGIAAGLGKVVGLGGWVRGRWGVTPTKPVADLRSHNISPPTPSKSSIHYTPPKPILRPSLSSIGSSGSSLSRTPGINQAGAIPGFWIQKQPEAYRVQLQPEIIDEEGLKEGLAEGLTE
jgi:hypothetical protein